MAVDHRHNKSVVDQPGELPASLSPGGKLELALHVPRAALPAWRALILVHSHGDIALEVNGTPAQPVRQNGPPDGHRSEMFVEFADQYWDKESRPKPENCRTFRAAPACLVAGSNRLSLISKAHHDLEIERVNLGLW